MREKNTSQAPANCRNARVVGLRGRSERFMASIQVELREMFGSFRFGDGPFHLGFAQDKILEHQRVHVRGEETTIRVLRRANDRFAANVEASIDDDRATSE